MSGITNIGVIGAGVVGQTFAQLLDALPQYQVKLGSRTGETSMEDAAKDAAIVFLTVSDSAIQTVCQNLVAANAINADAVVVHCSGALTSETLNSHTGPVASVHPLQTFPSVEAALPKVAGTYCYCEGDEAALKTLQSVIAALRMQPVTIQAQNKPLYHAAAVMACNNLCALMETALQFGEAANIPRETLWASLKPLIGATIENIDKQGPKAALTGPVARGDVNTVASHLEAIQASSVLGNIQEGCYRELGLQAAELTDVEEPALALLLAQKRVR